MKATCGRQALLSELQVVARAAATRGAIQALSGVRLETTDTGFELAATDTEIALRSSLEASVEQPGVVLLPARLLVDILRALEGESVLLEQRAEAGEVTVSSERATFSLRTLLADDFPRIPEAPDEGGVELPAKAVAETIDRVAKAASRDETRPVLTGVWSRRPGPADGRDRLLSPERQGDAARRRRPRGIRGERPRPGAPGARPRDDRDRRRDDQDCSARQPGCVRGRTNDPLVAPLHGQFPNYPQLLPQPTSTSCA